MFDSKFIATLFAVAISVIAICNINTNKITSSEGFGFGGLPSTTTKIQKCVANSWDDYYNGNIRSIPNSTTMQELTNKNTTNITPYSSSGLGQTAQDYAQRQVEKFTDEDRQAAKARLERLNAYSNQGTNGMNKGMNKGDFFSTANWETFVPPRFENSGQGPITRVSWNEGMIDSKNMAVPVVENPLAWAGMVSNGKSQKDNFVEPYVMEKSLMMPNYSEGNYNSLGGGDLMVTSDLFPVQNMSALNGVDKNGQPTQCVFFDRIIHSNRNNRRRGQGDQIRGDLPIIPINNGWFNPSANPVDDLQQGALGVIGGQSEASIRLSEFIKSSGNGGTIIGGIDTSQKSLSTNQQMNTVQASR